jgi:hypothetical protein
MLDGDSMTSVILLWPYLYWIFLSFQNYELTVRSQTKALMWPRIKSGWAKSEGAEMLEEPRSSLASSYQTIAKFLRVGDLAANGCSSIQGQGCRGFVCLFAFACLGQTEQLREQRELGLDVALGSFWCCLDISLVPKISFLFWSWNSLWTCINH